MERIKEVNHYLLIGQLLIPCKIHLSHSVLGSLTGVDLPGEVSGYTSRPSVKGNILDYAIGQFATYTTLQLAQYVSTIANDGYRVAPKVLKEVREPSPDGEVFGRIADETPIKVLNRINNTEAKSPESNKECITPITEHVERQERYFKVLILKRLGRLELRRMSVLFPILANSQEKGMLRRLPYHMLDMHHLIIRKLLMQLSFQAFQLTK